MTFCYCRGLYNYTLGSFPFLRVVFHFQRRFGYYFFAVYLPSFIVVLLSWVAFWIDPKAVPARICIGEKNKAQQANDGSLVY